MSGMGAFYSAVSGLKGHLFSMSIVGNNIANVNTNGYKSGRATFQEALVQTIQDGSSPRGGRGGINSMQVGLGMEVSSVSNNLTQGMLQTTGIVTDLGIDGDGFFVLRGGNGRNYTRSGNFVFDAQGNLTSRASGEIVQGWMAAVDGTIASGTPVTDIHLPFGETVPGKATTEVIFNSNLDATATTSTATLNSAGTTGIDYVNGMAANGAGGQHSIVVTGVNATASTATGTNATGAPITGSTSLATVGVTDASDFTLSVDGGAAVAVTGLSTTSTVTELINAINDLNVGITAELSGGEVKLTRDYAGLGSTYNITTSLGVAGNISNIIFGAAVGNAFTANNGTESTISAIDTFTPTNKTALGGVSMTVTYDSLTGLANGFSDVGGGGITMTATNGLAAGTALIDTAPTEHATSLLVYDSLGETHTLNMTFSRSGQTNLWYWEASFDGSEEITGGPRGTVVFNSDGSLRTWSADDGSLTLNIQPGGGAERMVLDLKTGSIGLFDGLTQFAAPSTATAFSQDGFGMGNLNSISIGADGRISVLFSNGVVKDLAQVVLARFANPDGLTRTGGNLYLASANSGMAVVGEAGTVVDGKITSRALEMSNVDLSEEFVNMIVAQRGFQANARVITTGDEMTTELINLKR